MRHNPNESRRTRFPNRSESTCLSLSSAAAADRYFSRRTAVGSEKLTSASRPTVGFIAAIGTSIVLAGAPHTVLAQSSAVPRVKISSSYITATGCHENFRTFVVAVPNIDKLDRSFHGVLDGIEVVETAGNNGHAYKNFGWASGGVAISYDLYAKGAGYWVNPPKILGVTAGGGYCHKAAGGSEGVDVYAHYKS
jgi:hypothetical protein